MASSVVTPGARRERCGSAALELVAHALLLLAQLGRHGVAEVLHLEDRWSTPFYGVEDRGWFLAMHCFAKYVKVTFLNGGQLEPMPPVSSKQQGVRYAHVGEHDEIDEAQWRAWIEQAAALPGEDVF